MSLFFSSHKPLSLSSPSKQHTIDDDDCTATTATTDVTAEEDESDCSDYDDDDCATVVADNRSCRSGWHHAASPARTRVF